MRVRSPGSSFVAEVPWTSKHGFFAALIGLALTTTALPRPAGATPEPPATAANTAKSRELFRKAVREYQQGNTRDAYEDYLTAWELQQSYDIAGNLANVELELARYRDAADHATYALAHFPPMGTDRQRAFLENVLREAKARLVTVTVTVDTPNALVVLDGKPIGNAPLSGDLYLDAGDHEVVASLPDGSAARHSLHGEKGKRYSVTLTLVGTKPVKDAPPPVPPPPPPQGSGLGPVALTGFIAGGAGIAAGVVLAVAASNKAGDSAALRAQISPGGAHPNACAGGTSAACKSLQDSLQAHDTLSNASFWAFVGGSALATGALVLVLRSSRSSAEPTPTGLLISPALGPTMAGVIVRDSF